MLSGLALDLQGEGLSRQLCGAEDPGNPLLCQALPCGLMLGFLI